MQINKYIDHTLLKAIATEQEIIKLCNEAKEYNFCAVCVNGSYVKLAKQELKNSTIKIASVIGFPLGAMSTEVKIFEAKKAITDGATEIDMVINIGKLIDGEYEYVENEISQIKQNIGKHTLKVIFENCYLTPEQIKVATQLAINTKADFIKTSTGFGTGGANFEDISIMKNTAKGKLEIKASGGIKDIETAKMYIDIGVTRLGTSAGVSLITEDKTNKNQY